MTNQPAPSDTPRVDAFIIQAKQDHGDMWASQVPKIARLLELEIARLSAERETLQREIDDSLTKWTKTRAAILEPAECGVPGHFKFQENGMKCSMCQKQRWLVQQHEATLAERDKQLAEMQAALDDAECSTIVCLRHENDELKRQKAELEGFIETYLLPQSLRQSTQTEEKK